MAQTGPVARKRKQSFRCAGMEERGFREAVAVAHGRKLISELRCSQGRRECSCAGKVASFRKEGLSEE